MPTEQREGVTRIDIKGQRETGGARGFDGRRQPSVGGTSRMTGDCHVRFCEKLGVKFPGLTRRFSLAALPLN